MKRILAIWLPHWPVQRLVSTRPELRHRPVVFHQSTPRGRCVAACCSVARKLGVHEGMPIVEAAALVRGRKDRRHRRGAALHTAAYDPREDRRALTKLAQWCRQYSPCVGLEDHLEDQRPPETLLLEAAGTAPLFGGEQALVQRVARDFHRLKLTAHIALADAVGTAWAVAHYGCQDPAVAETNIVPAGNSREAIGLLPLEALRLPPAMLETLGSLGLEHIGQVLSIPRVELQVRFTSLLLKRLDQALGAAAETICPVQPQPDFIAQHSWESPVDRLDVVQHAIEQLVEQLLRDLSSEGEGVLRLACQLSCQDAPPAGVEVSLFQPSINQRHLLELIEMQLERTQLPGPVQGVLLRVTQHARLAWRQQGLFDQERPQGDSRQLASLVDRLSSRLGAESVVRCLLRNDAQPELAYYQQPLVDQPLRRANRQAAKAPFAPTDRPLHLFKRPVAVQLMAMAPEGPPIRFRYQSCDYVVARHWGPERIETGWWRRRGAQRDYYRLETTTGHRFWVFRQIDNGRWFLHGVF